MKTRLFRSVSRQKTSNTSSRWGREDSASMTSIIEGDDTVTGKPSLSSQPSCLMPVSESPAQLLRSGSMLQRNSSLLYENDRVKTREYRGILEKQKGTMRTWPRRWVWVKEGRLLWAEIKKNVNEPGKERGGVFLSEIINVERKPTEEKPWQFIVKTEDRTINFAAENENELKNWIDVLSPLNQHQTLDQEEIAVEEDEESNQVLRRFGARLVRSEEVVVTVRTNLSVEISKFIGGGFRLRLDELQANSRDAVSVDVHQARALNLGCDNPLCVVAHGDTPWSAAESDGGSCFLAMVEPEAQHAWQDIISNLGTTDFNFNGWCKHGRLAGWKLAQKWWQLFGPGANDPALTDENPATVTVRRRLEVYEHWLRTKPALIIKHDDNTLDHRIRFPTRYCAPPAALSEKTLVISVSLANYPVSFCQVPCVASTTIEHLLADLAGKAKRRTSFTKLTDDGVVDEDSNRAMWISASTSILAGEACVLRVAGIRSYLVSTNAPLVASADVVRALRDSTKPVPIVGLVLETKLSLQEAECLQKAKLDLQSWYGEVLTDQDRDRWFPVEQTAAALRDKPPNVSKLTAMPDALLEPYIPQLVQGLKTDVDTDQENYEAWRASSPTSIGTNDDDNTLSLIGSRHSTGTLLESEHQIMAPIKMFSTTSPQGAKKKASKKSPTQSISSPLLSPLVKFLFTRALRNPTFVGVSFFWALRSEMSKGGLTAMKHGALLAAYLGAVGTRFRAELEKQVVLDAQLRWITASARKIEDKHARTLYATRELRRLCRSGELPAFMDLPCLPGRRVGRIRPDACRVLSSKAAPLLLVFDDDDPDPNQADHSVVKLSRDLSDVANVTRRGTTESNIPAFEPLTGGPRKILSIFKTRDDLRQDAAMLQVMRQMDALWLAAGIECWLTTYTVMATDVDVGWIEVVMGAKETAEIQSVYGSGALGAFQNNTLHNYLVEHNEDPKAFAGAQERFVASCAACCVATYLLGIADRHNGNIMLLPSGKLFHIDFGHVLGNFKKLKGTNIKREKTKLVLTPEMMYIINEGRGVHLNENFVQRCISLIAVLQQRGNGALLHTLLAQLVPADLPELTAESIHWLPQILLNPDIKNELTSALSDWVRRLDNANHNRIHQTNSSGSKGKQSDHSHAGHATRRVSSIMEAQHEIEELRRLLSLAEAKNAALLDQLAALQASGDGPTSA
mmetsp:Transcript_6713/g.9390  ORF Transcript_6713/g.9390 Transcript_6713/m.9390 type:complete len:1192 (-) Transcript_6713:198-3773(-)